MDRHWNDKIWESNIVKLLGVNINRDLKFNGYMLNICSKANIKLTILCRMFKYLIFEKRRVLVRWYFESQFEYCPLGRMFHRRQNNNRIKCLHERALRMIYDDSTSSLVSLLERDNSFSVHDCNIQQLAMEMYKIVHGLASEAISVLLIWTLSATNKYFGQNSVKYLGPIIWNSRPLTLRNVDSFSD